MITMFWLLEIEVKLMYYEQFCCIMHWFRLNQGLSKALDSFEIVQGSVRLSACFLWKNAFFIFILSHTPQTRRYTVGSNDKKGYYFQSTQGCGGSSCDIYSVQLLDIHDSGWASSCKHLSTWVNILLWENLLTCVSVFWTGLYIGLTW